MTTQSTRVLRSQAAVSEGPSHQLENAEVETLRMPSPHGEEMPSTTLKMPPKKGEKAVPEDVRAASTDAEDETSDDESDEHPRWRGLGWYGSHRKGRAGWQKLMV